MIRCPYCHGVVRGAEVPRTHLDACPDYARLTANTDRKTKTP